MWAVSLFLWPTAEVCIYTTHYYSSLTTVILFFFSSIGATNIMKSLYTFP